MPCAVAEPLTDSPSEVAASRLHHLMQLLPAGVLVLDEAGSVREANPQAHALLGEPLLGEPWRAVIGRAFAPQADDGHEISLKDGRRVRLATRALDPEPGQLVMLTDLTETRQLQHNLSHLQRLSALGKMAASLAHQIRTPLSAALLYAANLGNRNLDEAGRVRFQDKLMARLGELEQRVNDLLLFARGGHTQQLEQLPLAQLAERLSSSCEAALERRQASLSVQVPAKILVRANPDALVSALQNLVNNALEAGADALRLEAEIQGAFVACRLMDNGKGMSPQEQAQVLTPFFTTKSNGTGLGLAVVHSVSRAHGGRLELQSVPGQGSCFTLVLPLAMDKDPSDD
ncbi:sensor histidine kinase [Ferrimonas balearica]|uniref:sensor histidine kinase n=1 Tax=Ferrimonas balearica TaxID=44012 RepID=UPI001C991C84|nr:PAS domain-containing sensor histidine kinase [Ferrimonas balearica]MBY5990729.1 PAS domain-containing sensor histidine kinase [Ferrimonas balearica]